MDTQTAIATLKAFDNTLASQQAGTQGIRDALALAMKLLADGYISDQAAIDAAVAAGIQAYKDSLNPAIPQADTLLTN